MRNVGFWCICACLLIALGASPAVADVLVLHPGGKLTRSNAGGVASFGPRSERVANPQVRKARISARRRTVTRELRRIYDAGAIDYAEYAQLRDEYRSAKSFADRLPAGRRRIEMTAAVTLLERMAERGRLTVGRLEPLWTTLARNREWWSEGPLLASGRRVSFEGSEVVWQYVPYQGLQIHPLANFGKLNALWRAKRRDDQLELMLDELLALAAERSGGLAWEYYFDYGGGRAPWVSGLAQGTALQALARAATKLGRTEEVLPIARQGLTMFEQSPPEGVRLNVGDGAHYLIYSFNPRLRVINGFVQALVGLYDFSTLGADDRARALFDAGDRLAQREVPQFDTGAWSLYSRVAVTRESDLSYHKLLTGFLDNLCQRTGTPVYCDTAGRFNSYLDTPPSLELVSSRVRGGTSARVRFEVSKISRVTMRITRGGRTAMLQSATLGRGERYLTWSVPRRAGEYDVRLTAVDLAGNATTLEGLVTVLKPRKRRR